MHGCHSVLRVAVRADGICVFLCEHGTADNDLGARLFLTQLFNGLFHADNRRRHQCTQADHRNIFLDSGINDHLGRNVLAEVEHLIGVVFQQNLDDILADIVNLP